ncbi:MAG: response regulator transcription factor [Proteobacteria bacterium]|nr:response regulator transcription factor [Pseudomonadota bacterium]
MNQPIESDTVYLVDDDAAVRDSISLLIETVGLNCRTYPSAEAFLAGLDAEIRGCLILDMRMEGMSGFELQEELNQRGCMLPTIFLSAHGDVPTTVRAMKAGAADFLTKPVNGALLLDRVQSALALAHARRQAQRVRQNARRKLESLTEREFEILKLATGGQTNKEIARELGISFRTVEVHRSHILLKTGATSLFELSQLLRVSGLLTDAD